MLVVSFEIRINLGSKESLLYLIEKKSHNKAQHKVQMSYIYHLISQSHYHVYALIHVIYTGSTSL